MMRSMAKEVNNMITVIFIKDNFAKESFMVLVNTSGKTEIGLKGLLGMVKKRVRVS
jgi:hypothetical protein